MSTATNTIPFIPGTHTVRPIPFKAHKAHKVVGFSPEILEAHYEDFYGAAVQNLNKLELQLAHTDVASKIADCHYEEEYSLLNDILLHEVYFDSLAEAGGVSLENPQLESAICAGFSSVEAWRDEFLRLAFRRYDIEGWIVLAWSQHSGRLLNLSLTDTAKGLFGVEPLLALDMCRHAYLDHFGNQPDTYARVFVENIDWQRVGSRFDAVRSGTVISGGSALDDSQITVQQLKIMVDSDSDCPLILDVRHDDDRARYRKRVLNTDWRDSFKVQDWVDELPGDKQVVVYCMYGFWVSQKVAQELRLQGIDARSLSGGVTAWRAMGYGSSDFDDDLK